MPVEVIGAKEVAAKCLRCAAEIKGSERLWLAESGKILEDSIRQNIYRQRLVRTGKLANSGRIFGATAHQIFVSYGRGVVHAKSGSPYAPALEEGAGRHPISGKGGGWLYFYWENRGDWFSGPSVTHPGVRAYGFMRHGSEEAMIPIAMLWGHGVFKILGIR